MGILSLKTLRMFLNEDGFDYVCISAIKPKPGMEFDINCDISDIDGIKDVKLLHIDRSNHYRPFMMSHIVECRFNNTTDVMFTMTERTHRFIRFIQRKYGFNEEYICVTDRDIRHAIEDNDLEWFEKLFTNGSNAHLEYMFHLISIGIYTGSFSTEVKAVLIKEMASRGLSHEEDISL